MKGCGPGQIAITVVLVSGILGTFAYKLMNSQQVQEGGHQRAFYHPYMQTLTMNIGQLLCLALFYLNRKTYQSPLQQGKNQHNLLIFIVPGACDATVSIMQYMALNFISGSTYRILVGATIVTTLLFSKILLKIKIHQRQVVGCGLAVLGLVVVGLSSLAEDSSEEGTSFSLALLGYLLMIGSLFISGFFYSYEQLLLQRHTIHPLQMVGWQGFFGFIIVAIVSTILTFVPCTLGQSLCVYNEHGDLFFERIDGFFRQVCTNWILALLVAIGILTVSFANASGVAITKYYDSLTRCLVVMSKTAGVWLIGLVVTFSVDDDSAYKLQSKSLAVNLIKLAGFICIIFGTLIYNKLLFPGLFKERQHQQVLPQRNTTDDLLKSSESLDQ